MYLADKIRIPIFLAHGKMDERAPVEHAEKMRKALKKNDIEHEWLLEKKEAHGFYNPKARKRLYTELLKFFDDHIGS